MKNRYIFIGSFTDESDADNAVLFLRREGYQLAKKENTCGMYKVILPPGTKDTLEDDIFDILELGFIDADLIID